MEKCHQFLKTLCYEEVGNEVWLVTLTFPQNVYECRFRLLLLLYAVQCTRHFLLWYMFILLQCHEI